MLPVVRHEPVLLTAALAAMALSGQHPGARQTGFLTIAAVALATDYGYYRLTRARCRDPRRPLTTAALTLAASPAILGLLLYMGAARTTAVTSMGLRAAATAATAAGGGLLLMSLLAAARQRARQRGHTAAGRTVREPNITKDTTPVTVIDLTGHGTSAAVRCPTDGWYAIARSGRYRLMTATDTPDRSDPDRLWRRAARALLVDASADPRDVAALLRYGRPVLVTVGDLILGAVSPQRHRHLPFQDHGTGRRSPNRALLPRGEVEDLE